MPIFHVLRVQVHEFFSQLAPDQLFSLDDICNLAIRGTDHLVHSATKRSKMGLLHITGWHGAQLNHLFESIS